MDRTRVHRLSNRSIHRATLCLLPTIVLLSVHPHHTHAATQQEGTVSVARASPLPVEYDGPFQLFHEKPKRFIVVAASKTGIAGADLPFAEVDGDEVAKAFENAGYTPLAILAHENATDGNVQAALREIRIFDENASVIFYYSGHGIVDPSGKDLWLQLSGQQALADHLGVSIGDIIEIIRGGGYEGEIALIIDACFSGQAALTGALTLKELGKSTVLLTSSSNTQESHKIDLPDGTTMSAFTFSLLQALTQEWDEADYYRDGILRYDDLFTFTKTKLRTLYRAGRIKELMTPRYLTNNPDMFITYSRERVRNWRSPYRDSLTSVALNESLAPELGPENRALVPQLKADLVQKLPKPEISPEAIKLATQIPEEADSFTLALKSTAEGKFDEAQQLYANAAEELEGRRQQAEQRYNEEVAQLYRARGRNEFYGGRYAAALDWYEKAAQSTDTRDPVLLTEIANAYFYGGRYEEAEPIYETALAIREEAFGAEHPKVAESLLDLGSLFERQARYAEAKVLVDRACRIQENALEPTDVALLGCINASGSLYYSQGLYTRAEVEFRRKLEIEESVFEQDSLLIAASLNNLANALHAAHRYSEAIALYERSRDICVKALDAEDPRVAVALENLANAYIAVDRYREAEPLLKKAKNIKEMAYGPDHDEVATTLRILAELYLAQGRYEEKEAVLSRALEILEKAYGPSHPEVADVVSAMANLNEYRGRFIQAEWLYECALTIREHAFGKDDPSLARDFTDLAHLYYKYDRWDEAESLYKRVLGIFGTGDEYPDNIYVARGLRGLGEISWTRRDYVSAESLLLRSLSVAEKTFGGVVHTEVAVIQLGLGAVYYEQERYDEGASQVKAALSTYTELLGPDQPHVAGALNELGNIYQALGRHVEAEAHYQQALRIYEERLGTEHDFVATVLENYSGLLWEVGRDAEAQRLASRASSIRSASRYLVSANYQAFGRTDEALYRACGHMSLVGSIGGEGL